MSIPYKWYQRYSDLAGYFVAGGKTVNQLKEHMGVNQVENKAV